MNTAPDSTRTPDADASPPSPDLPLLGIAAAYVFAISTWLAVVVLLFNHFAP